MKTIIAVLTALAVFAVCIPVLAADEPAPPPPGPPPAVEKPAPPPAAPDKPAAPPLAPAKPAPKPNTVTRPAPPSGAPTMANRAHDVIVGPTDSNNNPRQVRGKVSVVAVPPPSAAITSVEVFFNSALIGQTSQKPYKVEFNTDTVSPGLHTFKAVGLGADGKQVWTASTAVAVSSATVTVAAPVKPAAPPAGPNGPKPAPSPNATKPATVITPPAVSKPAPSGPQGAVALQKTYTSTKAGFLVRYPAGWVVKDQTSAMKPKKAGNIWIAIMPNVKVPSQVINVRRMRVDPKTTADVFAKYNPYVSSWEKKTALASPAFSTTSNVAPKKVIHRLIVIKNGYAWMLNCVDGTGDSAKSRQLFDSVVASFALAGGHPTKAVTVTEKGKKH